jgi:hypothetical protein
MTNRNYNRSETGRAENGTFTCGHKKRGGRKAGTPNKFTPPMKDAIIEAVQLIGSDGQGEGGLTGYFTYLALNHPKLYAKLLGKMLVPEFRAELARRPAPKTSRNPL